MKIDTSLLTNSTSTQLTQRPKMPDTKLKKACQDFESMLVSQMLNTMRSTIPKNELFGKSNGEDIFQGMMYQEVANSVAQTGTLGIAEQMYAQISGNSKSR